MFTPVLDPPHRMPDLQCNGRDGNVLRHDAILAAEAAAHVRRDDADLFFGHAEHPGKRKAFDLAALRREVDDEFIKPIIPIGEHAASFERDGRLAIQPEPAP